MKKVKVSIIVPVYNSEKYITETINSITKQTLKEIEIILVNDGSTDRSLEILKQKQKEDKRIIVIDQENGKVSKARNSGLEKATGEFVGFVDSDDLVYEDMYETLYNNAMKEQADISMISMEINSIIKRKKINIGSAKKYILTQKQSLDFFLKQELFTYDVVGKIFKKEVYQTIRFVENKNHNEDKYFFFQGLCKAKKVIFEDVLKYRYMQREGSLASHGVFKKSFFELTYFAERIAEDIKKMNSSLTILAKVNLLYTILEVYRNLMRDKRARKILKKEKKELKNQLRRFDIRTLKSEISKMKKIELFLAKHTQVGYLLLIKIYDQLTLR